MWKSIIAVVLTLAFLAFAIGFFYSQVPGAPVELGWIGADSTDDGIEIEYGATPVFSENMRFNHNLISYYIESDCSEERKQKMKTAFGIFHDEINIISFYEAQKTDADILVGCSRSYVETDNNMFIAGEGGPSQYLNGTLFDVILEGKITLYKESSCDYPVIELHELMHVFGFNHINNIKSIMHKVSNCEQRITPDMVDTMTSLYEINALPDIYIDNVNATKKRYYLDFEVTVRNRGMVDAGEVVLMVSTESDEMQEFSLEDLPIYTARTLMVQNLKLPSRFDEQITFNVSLVDNSQEIDFRNNVAVMVVED
ncbi:hypothetical protein CMI37_38205 [Candidatus Pacearchaeota archaeon]|nr:hypothetical protein [Candidatus Pacearchaeota archaeon]|tara:strand:- start:177 stop:1112 length:936 start_codon:yes stop_codon:yes gene_type:complete